MGLSKKSGGSYAGSPYHRDHGVLGSILGPPVFGNYQILTGAHTRIMGLELPLFWIPWAGSRSCCSLKFYRFLHEVVA